MKRQGVHLNCQGISSGDQDYPCHGRGQVETLGKMDKKNNTLISKAISRTRLIKKIKKK